MSGCGSINDGVLLAPFAHISDLGAFRCSDRRGSCEKIKKAERREEAEWTWEQKKQQSAITPKK